LYHNLLKPIDYRHYKEAYEYSHRKKHNRYDRGSRYRQYEKPQQKTRIFKPNLTKNCNSIIFFEEICDTDQNIMKKKDKRAMLKYHPDRHRDESEKYNEIAKNLGQCRQNIINKTYPPKAGECKEALDYLRSKNE
jgi:hypothetical protein